MAFDLRRQGNQMTGESNSLDVAGPVIPPVLK